MNQKLTLPSGKVTELRRLNVGCGFDYKDGYINIDLQSFHNPDVVGDVLDMPFFPSHWFEEIMAKDVLEHFQWRDTPRALHEWNRLLAPGGRLFISSTNLTGLLRRIESGHLTTIQDHKRLIIDLFSMQAYEGDFHLTAFTERLLRYHVWANGFEIESLTNFDGWLFHAWLRKVEDRSFDDLLGGEALSDEEFVTAVYRRILEREPDESGLAHKLAELASGFRSRREVLITVLLSEERESLMMSRAPDFALTFDPS